MRGKVAKQLRKMARLTNQPAETTYGQNPLTGMIHMAPCQRKVVKAMKYIRRNHAIR